MKYFSTWAILAGMLIASFAVATPAEAVKLRTLYSFTGSTDGSEPYASVIRDSAGNLYGTTQGGGVYGRGVVFRVTPEGAESVLHSFNGTRDGGSPRAPLNFDNAGNVYGTAPSGGDKQCQCGVVFKVTPEEDYNVVRRFQSTYRGSPLGAPVIDAVGNIYGASGSGVYKISPDGRTVTRLHSFSSLANNGSDPQYGVVMDSAGNLFGSTIYGGSYGLGIIYKIGTDRTFTILHQIGAGPDRATPNSNLFYANLPMVAENGDLYGSMEFSGPHTGACNGNGGCGTVYRLTQSGNEKILYTFTNPQKTGNFPFGQVVRDNAGNLYGAANGGPNYCNFGIASPCGVIFKLTPAGVESILYAFHGPDGAEPISLVIDKAGHLYGATFFGGTRGFGSVFEIDP
ncbi:MAG TPA: choice-of-anchor tandem repeat GloVer-containing protein [Rhizomicrobium sp.]|jgi:uncharacterized repeat protein (TIGR03803 family)